MSGAQVNLNARVLIRLLLLEPTA